MTNTDFINKVRAELDSMSQRSYWNRGVNAYAHDFADELEEALDGGYIEQDDLRSANLLEKQLLNGADNWSHYCWSGCTLCYNDQIAERLCTPTELKRTRNGMNPPNSREDWQDVQTRAVVQAYSRIRKAIHRVWEAEHATPQSDGVKKLAIELGRLLLPRY